ncbi:dienelactone hydrolase family protein [Danxiaibacter flavus]|uniref:Dienelactone hydrolase family protein n=1 Tax=Danxiaibacter flavus TaxID=3049108 RepID=A0ABV3ZMJ6_9BACT|nr:dienelactone hydrolase family protein [Chitinophagaceae bacterium DXS]
MKQAYTTMIGLLITVITLSCSKNIADVPAATVADIGFDERAATTPITEKETDPPVLRRKQERINSNIGGYAEILPKYYYNERNKAKRYPLIVFLHGWGQRGNGTTDLYKLEWYAIPQYVVNKKFPGRFNADGKLLSFVIICPQNDGWPSPNDVNATINFCVKKYKIDTSRIYLCGMSMGGGNAWDYTTIYRNKLAAIVPICGASDVNSGKALSLAKSKTGIWAFHNSTDPVVQVAKTKNYVSSIVKYHPIIYPKATIWARGSEEDQHDAWTKATNPEYRESGKNIYEWMLQFRRTD